MNSLRSACNSPLVGGPALIDSRKRSRRLIAKIYAALRAAIYSLIGLINSGPATTQEVRMTESKTAMVVSAHSADFVWRAGGAVALYAARGWRGVVVCPSFRERGESAKPLPESVVTLEKVQTH